MAAAVQSCDYNYASVIDCAKGSKWESLDKCAANRLVDHRVRDRLLRDGYQRALHLIKKFAAESGFVRLVP